MKRALALVLALALVCSPVAPLALAGTSTAAPAGMSTIPDASIQTDVPDGESIPLQPADLDSGGVLASNHADTLDVVLTTTEHAPEVMGSDSAVVEGDGMALVLRDDTHSAGHEVAIDAGKLKEGLGYVPDAIYGTHEDGSSWTRSATYEDGYLIFDVPHFSDNAITFSSSVEITADGASDGATFSYDLSDLDAASEPNVTLTGANATEDDSVAWSDISDGASKTVSVGGTTPARDSDGIGDPTLTMTGRTSYSPESEDWSASASDRVWGIGIDGQYGFAASGNGNIYAYYQSNGTEAWSSQYTFSTRARGVSSDQATGHVFAVGQDSAVVKMSRSSGSTSWSQTLSEYPASVTANDTHVFAMGTGGKLFVLHRSDGSFAWNDTVASGGDDIRLRNGDLMMANQGSGEAIRYDPATQSIKWSTTVITGDESSLTDLGGNSSAVFAVTSNSYDDNGGLYVLDPSDGSIGASNDYTTGLYGVASDGPRVYVGMANGDVAGYGTQSLSSKWTLSTGTDGGELDQNGSKLIFSRPNDNSATLIDSGKTETKDPAVEIDGATVLSYSGTLNDGSTTSTTTSLGIGDHSLNVSTSAGSVDVDVGIQEVTQTVDPAVEINGGNWLNHSGTLADGTDTTLSGNSSWLSDRVTNTVNVSVGDGSLSADAPDPVVDLNYSHDAQDDQTVQYEAEQWTSRYNVSKQYASDRASADLSIPHERSVVSVRDLEYAINGSAWSDVAADNYDLSGNDLSVDLDGIYGGAIPATTEIAVRSNASRVDPHNVTIDVLNATATGDRLDSKLRFEHVGPDAHLNVGPTQGGDRVHYLYDESWADPEESVVIESNGDQHLQLPNAEAAETARVTHLDTRVVANTGDVRIEVLEAGETPELDVSPGPGGEGDDVTVEYYNTRSGIEYILESLTNSIVLDSDTAESPAIFEDDDSEETWSIFEDDSNTSSPPPDDSGGPGQVVRDAGNGILDNLPLLLGLGGGLLVTGVVVSRLFGSSDSVAQATGTVARSTGSLTATLGRTTQTVLGGLLSWAGGLLAQILANRRAAIALGVVGLVGANALDLIGLPSGTATLLVVAGVPLASYVVLTSIGRYSQTIWVGTTAVATVLGLELIAPGTVSTAITQLTSETVAPLLILLVGGVAFYWFRIRGEDASTPNEVNQITIEGGDDGS